MLGDPRAFGLLLQLSREADPAARAEVCRALAALEDPRAADRLRTLLYDSDATVRDAAFTALSKLQSSQPLQYASAGLNAAHEDVRRRGLDALVRVLRKSPAQANTAGPALEMLARALNDSHPDVRKEAFKSTQNLQVAGGGIQTLRFILQSVHADVRMEVLIEVSAQLQEAWAWTLLLEFYNDPEAMLRQESFNTATQKNKELPPPGRRPSGRSMPDVRKLAVDALIKKHSPASQAACWSSRLADADKEVRQLAAGRSRRRGCPRLLHRGGWSSPHADIRVRRTRLASGTAKRPLSGVRCWAARRLLPESAGTRPARYRPVAANWLALAESALEGFAELGEPSAMVPLLPLLPERPIPLAADSSPHERLAWVAAAAPSTGDAPASRRSTPTRR